MPYFKGCLVWIKDTADVIQLRGRLARVTDAPQDADVLTVEVSGCRDQIILYRAEVEWADNVQSLRMPTVPAGWRAHAVLIEYRTAENCAGDTATYSSVSVVAFDYTNTWRATFMIEPAEHWEASVQRVAEAAAAFYGVGAGQLIDLRD
jgi:hypothetical protein